MKAINSLKTSVSPALMTLLLSLAACTPVIDRPIRTHIWDLYLRQPDGRIITYLDALAPIEKPPSRLNIRSLPLHNLSVRQIPDCVDWIKAYDGNANRRIDVDEMTQAWLTWAAELKTGNHYGPDGLLAYRVLADLSPGIPPPSSIRYGLSILPFEQAIVRNTLEKHAQGQTAIDDVETAIEKETANKDCETEEPTPSGIPAHGGTPPGQGGTPPGQGDGGTPPGQGGTPPGQGGTPPGQGGGGDGKPGKGPKK